MLELSQPMRKVITRKISLHANLENQLENASFRIHKDSSKNQKSRQHQKRRSTHEPDVEIDSLDSNYSKSDFV